MHPESGHKYEHLVKGLEQMSQNPEHLRPVRTLDTLKAECADNATLLKLFESMKEYLYRYTETVCEYHQILTTDLSEEERAQELERMEDVRGRVHNAMIDSVNIFSRALAREEKDNTWVGTFGGARAAYAKFALTAVYQELIKEGGTYGQS